MSVVGTNQTKKESRNVKAWILHDRIKLTGTASIIDLSGL
jgi:hypothetical protein